jgi:multidrug efflux pump subunit AcrA (membrane-fusion protein)
LSPLLAAADVRRPGWRLILSPTRALLAFATLLAIWLTAAPIAAQEAALVRVDKVTRQVMSQTVPVIGRLVARQAGEVSARIDGPIETFLVEIGDRVEAGQVIAVLNRDSLQARRDIAASQLGEMRAELATEEAEEALARLEFQRLEGLKKSAAFSQARHEDSRQNVAIAPHLGRRGLGGCQRRGGASPARHQPFLHRGPRAL